MRMRDERLRLAVRDFWRVRSAQAARQGRSGDVDRGGRGAVTGGKQMAGFAALVRDLLVEAGVRASDIQAGSRIELPGWFRAEKQWDLLVVAEGQLLAALEFKSQVGPSFGNNFNNRAEEAIGSATDLWAAYREGAFKPSARPHLGYFMLLEDSERSRSPVRTERAHFPTFPEFGGASYRDRYSILIEKLVRERLYDSACSLSSARPGPGGATYDEPHAELTFERFMTPLLARVAR